MGINAKKMRGLLNLNDVLEQHLQFQDKALLADWES